MSGCCAAMTFLDWCLVQSGDNRTHLTKTRICHTLTNDAGETNREEV